MSDPVLLALIAAIGSALTLLVGAFLTVLQLIQNKKQNVQAEKQNVLAIQTAEIHSATNGKLSELTKTNEVAIEKIEGLKSLIAEKDLAKQETQAAQAVKDAQPEADKAP